MDFQLHEWVWKNSRGYKKNLILCKFPFYLKINTGYLLQVISLLAENVFIIWFAKIKYIWNVKYILFLYVM